MMRMKRVLAMLLLAVMLFGTLPVAAVAWTDENVSVAVKDDKTVVTVSGLSDEAVGKTVICGWYLDEVLQDVRMGEYLADGITLTSDVMEYDELKCFLWEDGNAVTPCTGAMTPTLTDEKPSAVPTFSAEDFSEVQTAADGKLTLQTESGESVVLKADAQLTYNGFPITEDDALRVTSFFGTDSAKSLITPDSGVSGSVRLTDTDADNQCSGMELEVAVPVVLSSGAEAQTIATYATEEPATQTLAFQSAVRIPVYSVQNRTWEWKYQWELNPDKETVAELTKNGVTVSWDALNPGDVLMLKPSYDGESFRIEVLGNAACVYGYVRAIRNDGKAYLSDGGIYKVSPLGESLRELKAGMSGIFWIYRNEIVYYQTARTGEYQYGYIFQAVESDDTWGDMGVTMQMVTEAGRVLEVSLANSVSVENLDKIDEDLANTLSGGTNPDAFTLRRTDLTYANARALAKTLCGRLIGYNANRADEIFDIVFEQTDDANGDMYLCKKGSEGVYHQAQKKLDGIGIGKDTCIFAIADRAEIGGTLKYGEPANGAAEYSAVGRGGDLADGTYDYLAFDTDGGTAKAVVLLNAPNCFPSMEPERKYGYIFQAVDGDDTWGNIGVIMQMLTETDEVLEVSIASHVTVKNLDSVDSDLANTLSGGTNPDAFTLRRTDLTFANARELAKALCGRLVAYTQTAVGTVDSIVLEQTDDVNGEMYRSAQSQGEYIEAERKLDTIGIDEDTYIFSVTDHPIYGEQVEYGKRAGDAAEYSGVGRGVELAVRTYDYLAFDTVGGTAKAVVLLNAPNCFPTGASERKYGYIFQAVDSDDTWDGDMGVIMQMLTETDEVLEVSFANCVSIKNLDSVDSDLANTLSGGTNPDAFTLRRTDLTYANAKALAKALCGRLVAYTQTAVGTVDSIVLEQTGDIQGEMYRSAQNIQGVYREAEQKLDNIGIDAKTRIFYITDRPVGGGTVEYGKSTGDAAEYSGAERGYVDLAEGTYHYLAFEPDEDDVAGDVVILNTIGEISPFSHVAVIEEVGQTVWNGYQMWTVAYWQNGKWGKALVDADCTEITPYEVKAGDVFRFRFKNGMIVRAEKLFHMICENGVISDRTEVSLDSNGTGGVFGAVYAKDASGGLHLRWNGADCGVILATDAEDAKVYGVADRGMSWIGRIQPTSLERVEVNELLTKEGNEIVIGGGRLNGGPELITVDADGNTDHLLDWAYAYQYEGKVVDVVIYQPYLFECRRYNPPVSGNSGGGGE